MITKNEKIHGIVYAYTDKKRYGMVTDIGLEWIRLNIPFPWEDKMFGELSENWLRVEKDIKEAVDAGLKVMPSVPTMGSYNTPVGSEEVVWRDEWPDFVGEKGSDEYYDNVRKSSAFMCQRLGENAHSLWQCMNEIDIETFRGEYSIEIAVDTCRAAAEGITSINPNAVCGTNFTAWWDYTKDISRMLYRPGHKFGYCGIDGYYGSWHEGTVEKWENTINDMYEFCNMPVLVNEWGYSSGGVIITEDLDWKNWPKGWSENCYGKGWRYHYNGEHSPEAAAAYIKRGLEIFINNPNCLGQFMFCFSDAKRCWHCGQSECPSECLWGIVDIDLNPKPAYYVVKEALKG